MKRLTWIVKDKLEKFRLNISRCVSKVAGAIQFSTRSDVAVADEIDSKCTSVTLKPFLPARVLKRNIKVSSVSLKF